MYGSPYVVACCLAILEPSGRVEVAQAQERFFWYSLRDKVGVGTLPRKEGLCHPMQPLSSPRIPPRSGRSTPPPKSPRCCVSISARSKNGFAPGRFRPCATAGCCAFGRQIWLPLARSSRTAAQRQTRGTALRGRDSSPSCPHTRVS